MIQLYRERGGLSTGNSGNSPGNSGNGGAGGRRSFSREDFWGGLEVGNVPDPEGKEELEKSWKSPQTSPSAWNLGAVFPFFLQEKGPGWDLGSLPNPGFFWIIIPLPKEKKKKSPPFLLFSPFSSFFPPPAPLGMSRHVRASFLGTSGIPGLWNRLLPNKTHQEHSQREKKPRKNKKNPKSNKKKGGFCWKSFPRPIRIWEFLGRARRGPRNPKSPQNPTFPGDSRWDLGSSQSQFSLGHREGLRGCFMYTVPIPSLGADPGIPGILRFLGTLSSPQA